MNRRMVTLVRVTRRWAIRGICARRRPSPATREALTRWLVMTRRWAG